MTTVCAIQHVPAEGLGLIAEVLKARGINIELFRPLTGDRLPRSLGRHSGLVIMGGPMSVYEQHKYPFLGDEIRLISDALKKERPILGVCLGSQLLAAALGAAVTKGKHQEISWHPVTLTKAAATDQLWRGLPSRFTAFHWHGDIFDLARGAVSVARSSLTHCQAFRYGARAYGVLFHLEVTEPIVRRMTRTFRRELREAGVKERQVLEGVAEHLPALHTIGRTVVARWAALVVREDGADAGKRSINNAVALRDYLEAKVKPQRPATKDHRP